MNKGTVNKISTKKVTTKFGQKDVFSLQIDGEWYQAGFKRPPVAEGDSVSFDFKETQYGKDITRIDAQIASLGKSTPATTSATATSSRGGYDRTFPVALLSPERAIIRQNALGHATRVVSQAISSQAVLTDPAIRAEIAGTIIAFAREFEAYACGDTEREEVKDAS